MNDMRFLIKGVTINNRAEDNIKKRLQSLKKLLNKGEYFFEVEIDVDKKGKFRVEVMIKMQGKLYRAEETTESIEGSVDIVEEELRGQIIRDKERAITLRMRGGRSIKKKLVVDGSARF